MKNKLFKSVLLFVLLFSFCQTASYGASPVWGNDLRTMFIENRTVIYALNIRSFGAQDNNDNDIIEPWLGDTQGTFLNAIGRLKELQKLGINTIYLLPITKTGKLKALGTAGSLYALDSFTELNPQLDDKKNRLSVNKEAQMFIDAAHKIGMRVIVDVPSCGSYDMSLERPDLFVRDKAKNAVVPADWTDVRLFKVYDENGKLNQELLDSYKSLISMLQEIGADGIRADVAGIKPYEFWKEIIDYARSRDRQFLFLAEVSPSWTCPVNGVQFTDVNKLLEAGFDGYYGDWSNFPNFTKGKELIDRVQNDLNIAKQFNNQKSTIAAFATHDQQSVMLTGGIPLWEMVSWLNATLPTNSYFLDGYVTGDNYIYRYENKKSQKSLTDDDYYFVHRGKFDIFNLSRRPGGAYADLEDKFKNIMRFKYWAKNIIIEGSFIPVKTSSASVFAYARKKGIESVLVVGNLSKEEKITTNVYVKGLRDTSFISPAKMGDAPILKRGKLVVSLNPGEIQVYVLSKVNY